MPWNGSGVFNRIYSWVADANAGLDISATRMDTDTDDITTSGFGNCLTRDGQGIATANLPMGGFRHTGASNGVAATDYATVGQVAQFSVLSYAGVDPTGNTDSTTGLQNAINAAYAANSVVNLAPGKYLVSATLQVKCPLIGSNPYLTNSSQPCEIFTTTNINGPVLQAVAGNLEVRIEHLSVRGYNSNAAIGACIQIASGANGTIIFDVTTLNGKYGVQNLAADCTIECVDCANYYQAGIYTNNGALYLRRCSVDMGNSNIIGGSQNTLAAWQATHAYNTPGQAVRVGTPTGSGGIIMFLVTPGTSGSSTPSVVSYQYGSGGAINDGSAVWWIDAPYLNTFAGLYIDTGAAQIMCEDVDFSGDMYNSVYVAPGGTGGLPQALYFSKCTFNPLYYCMQVNSGSDIRLGLCYLRYLINDASTGCILLQGTFEGEFTITNSALITLAGCYGLSIQAPTGTPADIKVQNCVSMGGGTSITIAASVQGFIILGNTLGGTVASFAGNATALVLGNSCSNFNISHNFTGGVTVTLGSSLSAGTINNNVGYNPVGAASISTSASPYTYTAGASPETTYFSASTSITAATQGGVSILPAATGANAVMTIQLGPFEAVVITYTGSLTGKKMIH